MRSLIEFPSPKSLTLVSYSNLKPHTLNLSLRERGGTRFANDQSTALMKDRGVRFANELFNLNLYSKILAHLCVCTMRAQP